VLAARFADREAAGRVLQQLRASYDLGPRDAETAPLGEADDPDGLTLLAGRFHDTRVGEIRHAIEGAGGEIVADLDEGWTHPYGGSSSASAAQRAPEERQRTTPSRPGSQNRHNTLARTS
jgi:hypothetical protein